MRPALLLCGWLLAAPALLASSAEFEVRLWSPDLSGLARVGRDTGTTIDLVGDLGFGDEQLPQGRLVWRPSRRTSLRLDYSALDFNGAARLDRAVSFGGTTFTLDAQVDSRLDLEYGGLGFAWQLLSTADGRARLGPLIEVRGLRGEAEIRADLAGLVTLTEREEFELAFAAAGLALDFEPTPKVHLYAEWRTAIEIDDGNLSDVEAGIRLYLLEALAVTVGYRRLELDAMSGTEMFDLELDGPFLGAVLRF